MARYKSLLKVSDTHLFQIADLSVGHSATLEREGVNKTVFLAFFRNKQLELFVDQEKFYRHGKRIIDKAVSDPVWIKNLRRRSATVLQYIEHVDTFLATTNFSVFDNQFLAYCLRFLHETMKMGVLEFHDEIYPHYSLALEDKLNATLRRYQLDPSRVLPLIFRAKTPSPIEQYENDLIDLAFRVLKTNTTLTGTLGVFKKNEKLGKRLHEIFERYSWITAAWSEKGKSEAEMFEELKDYVFLGVIKLKKAVHDKKGESRRGRQEAERTLRKLHKILNSKENLLLDFAVTTVETGRIRMDAFYKLLFHAFNLYREIASRLHINMDDLRYTFKEELIDALTKSRKIPIKKIKQRQKHSLLYFKNGKCRLFVGREVNKWEKRVAFSPEKSNVFKGQIAYNGGVVKGKAKIILTPKDMKKMKKGNILVSSRTYPDLLTAMKKAGAIITELGGLLSHAAIVARELHIPCIVGITNITRNIKDNEIVSVDTATGIISKE